MRTRPMQAPLRHAWKYRLALPARAGCRHAGDRLCDYGRLRFCNRPAVEQQALGAEQRRRRVDPGKLLTVTVNTDPLSCGRCGSDGLRGRRHLRAAFHGEVVAANSALEQRPRLLSNDAFGAGWMLVVEPASDTWPGGS